MEEHIWDTSGSYLRGIAVYFLYSPNARKKTLFWRDAKIGFIYSLSLSLSLKANNFVVGDETANKINPKIFCTVSPPGR